MKDLLIEIGCEELPAQLLKKIQQAFAENIIAELKKAALLYPDSMYPNSTPNTQVFITPRRIAVRVQDVQEKQFMPLEKDGSPKETRGARGPRKQEAVVDKQWSEKAKAFAELVGGRLPLDPAEVPRLSFPQQPECKSNEGVFYFFEQTPGHEFLYYQRHIVRKSAQELLPSVIDQSLKRLSFGRRMRWGSADYHFFRPIHWIVVLFGDETIKTELFGVSTGNVTYGHRFHHPEPIKIPSPKEYEGILEQQGFVIVDYAKRRETIRAKMLAITAIDGHQPIITDALLDEVTGLVEWPIVLLGKFDQAFLNVPQEVLITALETHQKCFAVADQNGTLLNQFIIVSNLDSKDPNVVIAGNECVIRARLQDAVFYYDVDRKTPLAQHQSALESIVFQAGLGSLWDKSQRIAWLSKMIADKINANPVYTERAALLCKTDLLTQMVGEFPELQGVMGRYYALHDGEAPEVAHAIEEHYYPRFAQDRLPSTLEGAALSLADRIDTIVGLFGIGQCPKGDKDPFALRRHAIAILRILIEQNLDLDLAALINEASNFFRAKININDSTDTILDFCFERLRTWYHDRGIPIPIFESVLAKRPTNLLDFHNRIQAVKHFVGLKEAEHLSQTNKRVKNILAKNKNESMIQLTNKFIEQALLCKPAEQTLALQIAQKEEEISPLLEQRNYTEALISLAMLQEPVDQFFKDVMVMVDDPSLRDNRLKLLSRLRTLFLEIADISLL